MRHPVIFLLLVLLLAACDSGTSTDVPVVSPSPTLPASTSTASLTPAPPTGTPTATLTLIEGETTTLVNVRQGPGTGYASIGLLDEGSSVQVDLQSEDGTWLRIRYPAGGEGYGWVAALYIRLPDGSSLPSNLTLTPAPSGRTGQVTLRLNVRRGPGTGFEELGMLEAGAVVLLTGKNTTASWFQIEYPAGSGERGWVTSQYITTEFASELPIIDEYGLPLSTGTPGADLVPVAPTPTLGPAFKDDDSSSSPGAIVIFSSSGPRSLVYTSQLSNPEGDAEDWVEFTTYSSLPGADARLLASLTCLGNGSLKVEIWQAGALLPGWGELQCGDRDIPLLLQPGTPHQIRLLAGAGDGLQFVLYELRLENLP
jgi:uncharacterized protein YraI